MPTRKRIVTAVLGVAMVGAVAPGVAQAHHVASGAAQCKLVGNVPTITASASFVSFTSSNKPISGTLKVDTAVVQTISGFTFSGPNGTWNSAQHAVKSGPHHVSGSFTWPNQNGQSGRFDADVNCPAPPPPPVTPTPTPTPTSTPTPEPPTVTPPAPPAPAAAAPQNAVAGETASGPCVPRKLGKYRITVTPKGALHGLVTFHLKGRGVSNVRWYVDTHRAGEKRKRWEWVHQHGRAYSIYLWAQQRWGKHLWGRHTIAARFTVKDSCGKTRALHVQQLYFNHDPLPNDPIFAH